MCVHKCIYTLCIQYTNVSSQMQFVSPSLPFVLYKTVVVASQVLSWVTVFAHQLAVNYVNIS